jgi:hypothetical protein
VRSITNKKRGAIENSIAEIASDQNSKCASKEG